MYDDDLYEELKKRRIRGTLITLAVLAACTVAGYFLFEWLLTSMGLQAAPADFSEPPSLSDNGDDSWAHGYVKPWTGESTADPLSVLPDFEVTVEDYRMDGLSRVGRPSATQERLSTDLFVVVNDDPGNLVLEKMTEQELAPRTACTFSILVRDNPADWKTLSIFDPVTVTITVPDALVEDAFSEQVVVYAVYNKQYPDDPGGLVTLPVSVSEEEGICYASFLVREDYETEYALCSVK